MARLTTHARKALPKSDFAGPGRSYPDENKSHARNALARVSEYGTPAVKAEVRAKVHAKYPSIGKSHMKHESNHLHHESSGGLHERGHHESQRKKADREELSHSEFQNLDHGSKHDHMVGRDKEDY